MTDIIAKPFDWNDNFSEVAQEDFSMIQKSLSYCTCQSIGMALAKLELLEKQGCKVIEPSGSSSEKPKSECEHDHEILKAYSDGANDMLDNIKAEIANHLKTMTICDVEKDNGVIVQSELTNRKVVFYDTILQIIDKFIAEEDKA